MLMFVVLNLLSFLFVDSLAFGISAFMILIEKGELFNERV